MNERRFLDRGASGFRPLALCVLTAALCILATPSAQGQQYSGHRSRDYMDTMVSLKFMLGLAGEVEFEGPAVLGFVLEGEDDLEPTLGGGIGADLPLHKYFLLGAMFGFHSWIWDGAEDANWDRSFLLDFSLVPKGRYPFKNAPVSLYVGLPVGLCLNLFDEDNVAPAEVDVGLGLNFSALFGVLLELSDSVGLLAEIGYTLHSFSHDVEPAAGGTIEVDVFMEQFALNVGVYFM